MLKSQISTLKAEQKTLSNSKKAVAKELHNAVRRKKRLRTKVQNLTDEDLVEVLRQRNEKRTEQATGQSPSPGPRSAAQSQSPSSTVAASPVHPSLLARMSEAP